MSRYLLSVDPGLKTGFAVFFTEWPLEPQLIMSYELGFDGFQDAFESFLANHVPLHHVEVVIEDFKITPQTGKLTDAPWSLKHIGVVEFLCRKHGVELTLQPPSRAKNFVPNDRLKALNIWHKGGDGHALDALRHAVLYMVEQHNWRPANLLSSD